MTPCRDRGIVALNPLRTSCNFLCCVGRPLHRLLRAASGISAGGHSKSTWSPAQRVLHNFSGNCYMAPLRCQRVARCIVVTRPMLSLLYEPFFGATRVELMSYYQHAGYCMEYTCNCWWPNANEREWMSRVRCLPSWRHVFLRTLFPMWAVMTLKPLSNRLGSLVLCCSSVRVFAAICYFACVSSLREDLKVR